MKYNFLGNSGLRVSEIGIGTLTWGRDTDLEDANAILGTLLDAGGNLIDLSPTYGEGNAPNTLGELLRTNYSRSEFVICAHAGWLRQGEIWQNDLGRTSLITTVERQLVALDTDYLDLLIINDQLIPEHFINDYRTAAVSVQIPLWETLHAVQFLLQQGKIRYYAFSGFPAWKAALAWQLMHDTHCELPIAFAAPYSLLARQIETELMPFAQYAKLGIIGFAPLAGGVLTGKYRNTIPPTSRAATPHLADTVEQYLTDQPRRITQAVAKAADGLGRTPADISLAWLLGNPNVQALCCGPRTANQAEQLFKLDWSLLPAQVQEVLSEISLP